jgi:TonB-dependent receptor
MKKLFILTSLFILSAVAYQLHAQMGTITGRVLDESQLSLPGAFVYLDENTTTTNNDGYFTLIDIPVGQSDLKITYIGYEDQKVTVEIKENKVTSLTIKMVAGIQLQQVVVTGQLVGQAKALNNQLNRDNITNIIAADQIGRFPDANIGDAMKRIPGINVQYDQGEARFGNIRGTAPQLNSITINGERIPSAEAEVRSIQLDLIPSDMIQTIEVSKAVTADMDADAIGGSVNLITRAAPAGERISATLGGGYNALAEEPTFNGSLIYGNRFANDKLGLILSASYFNNNLGSDNVEAEWTYDDANDNGRFDDGEDFYPEEIQIRQYYLQRIRQSYSAALDYKFNERNSLVFRGIFNNRKDWENRYRAVFADIENDEGQWVGELERQTKGGNDDTKDRRLEDQDMMTFSLGGEHLLGRWKLDWSGSYSKASEARPNERYFEIATDGTVPLNADFSNPKFPFVEAADEEFQNPSSSWELSEITEEFQYTEDIDFNSRINLSIPLNRQNNSFLKLGTRVRTKTKKRDNDFYEYSPIDEEALMSTAYNNLQDETKDNFLPGDKFNIGQFVNPTHLSSLNLKGAEFEEERDLSELAGNFKASENIYATYAMVDHQLNNRLKVIAGVRFEQTELEYEGFVYDDETETLDATPQVSSDYLNILPSVHLKYNINPTTVLRMAYTNTLARPNYFDLVPYREIADGEELSIGNPDLEPTTSMNFDLMAEKYFGNVGILSGGLFYKDIKDFIVAQSFDDYEFEGTLWDNFSQPINGGNATLLGAEVAFQRQLDFISPALKGLGIYTNYTYTQSEVTDFNFEGRENDDIALPGSPEHTLNVSLSYDAKKFTTRLSFNYASDFIDEVGSEVFSDRYYDEVTYLDFNFNYSINKQWVVFFNANNLLNQPLRFFQGAQSRTMQDEYYGRTFNLGIKWDITR